MKQLLCGLGFAVALLIVITPQSAAADCGVIIVDYGGFTEAEPIEDCDNPFAATSNNQYPNQLFINNNVFLPKAEYASDGLTEFKIENNQSHFYRFARLYRHDGADYLQQGTNIFSSSFTRDLDIGTYTLVVKTGFNPPVLSGTPRSKIASWLIPTAYAQVAPDPQVETFTFSIVPLPPEPTGASSVLFLPGIQASRLYMDTFFGENRVWEPILNREIKNLELNSRGESTNDIYTRDVIDYAGGTDVYGSFIEFMNEQMNEEAIYQWYPFAYDWRQSVFDVVTNGTLYEDEVRYPVAIVESLASTSFSGKVTIVAHSNGGLLGKALIAELERLGKEDLIDNFIMVGTPQLGTPKGIGAMLHGYDQQIGGGLIIDDSTARDIIRNMPGAYGLLPGSAYYDSRNDIVIGFDASEATAAFREAYGNAVNADELDQFLLGAEGRFAAVSIHEAEVLNALLLAQANQERQLLDTWQAPAVIDVYEIIGVGLDTVSGFEYQSFPTWDCSLGICGRGQDIYKPVPYFTQYGDGTVVGSSADGYTNSKGSIFIDLDQLDLIGEEFREHADLTGSTPVKELIGRILKNQTTDSVAYAAVNAPAYALERSVLSTNSPVHFYVVDNFGNRTGRVSATESRDDIPGSQYFELAGSHYVIVPKGIDYEVIILGEDSGGMTFRAVDLSGEAQTETLRVSVATTSASTTVTFAQIDGTYTPLQVDVDGDGLLEYEVDLDGGVLSISTSYESFFAQLETMSLSEYERKPLIGLGRLAAQFSRQTGPYADAIEKRLLNKLLILIDYYRIENIEADWPTLIAILEKIHAYE